MIQLLPGPLADGQPAVPVRVEVWAPSVGVDAGPENAEYCVKLTGSPGSFDLPFRADRDPETVPHQVSATVRVADPSDGANIAKGFTLASYVPRARDEVATLFAALFAADCVGPELASTAIVLSLEPPDSDSDSDGGTDEDAGSDSAETNR